MLDKAKHLPFDNLLCVDIEEPLDLGLFDAIISVGVFDFVQNPQLLVCSLSKHLVKHGCLCLTIPETCNLELAGFSLPEIDHMLRLAGLKIMKSQRILGYKDSETSKEVYYWVVLGVFNDKLLVQWPGHF